MYGAYQNVWAQHPQDHPIWRDINHVRFPAAPSLPPSPLPLLPSPPTLFGTSIPVLVHPFPSSISGLVVEYIVAIDVSRVRFPADAW